MRPSGRHDYEGVDSLNIGPESRNRIDTFLSRLSEEHSVLAPGVGVADQLELLAGQRVEGMGNNEPSRTVNTICS